MLINHYRSHNPFALGRLVLITALLLSQLFVSAQTYWQQDVKYQIRVALDDLNHVLRGEINILYANNSPDTLDELWIHLWPNAYKDNNTAMADQLLRNGETEFFFSKDEKRGFIDSIDFRINGHQVVYEYHKQYIDVSRIPLNNPLYPGDSLTISAAFRVKIPGFKFFRMGHQGQFYKIAQWYPKPAVYDKDGWHFFPYLDMGEFYGEFGTYDVFITLPANYVVGATGTLAGPSEEYHWLKEKVDETFEKINFSDNAFPPSSKRMKTLHYHLENAHDFAWVADKRFNIIESTITPPGSKKKVKAEILFTNQNAPAWQETMKIASDILAYYTNVIGDYPYNKLIIIQDPARYGRSMEYPGLIMISDNPWLFDLEKVIAHEIAHIWFYGALGSNERQYPWLDEGLTAYYTMRYIESKSIVNKAGKYYNNEFVPGKSHRWSLLQGYYRDYLRYAMGNTDLSAGLDAPSYPEDQYYTMTYRKTALLLRYLESWMGTEKFDNAIKDYYKVWGYKHPCPAELRAVFEKQAGVPLPWFFDQLVATNAKIDYKISGIKKDKETGEYHLNIRNKGDVACPFPLGAYKDGKYSVQWHEGFKGAQTLTIRGKDIESFMIDPAMIVPEVDHANSSIRSRGFMKKSGNYNAGLFYKLPDPAKKPIFFVPVPAWNQYDRFLFGVGIYNDPYFPRKADIRLFPLYSASSGIMAGFGSLGVNFYKTKPFRHLRLDAEVVKFSHSRNPKDLRYSKLSTGISAEMRPKSPLSEVKVSIALRNNIIYKDVLLYEANGSVWVPYVKNASYYINELSFTYENKRIVNPYAFNVVFQQGSKMLKAWGTWNYRISYQPPGKGFDMRFFYGQFILKPETPDVDIRFRMSGITGSQDYLYQHAFFGRSETGGILSQQTVIADGGFKRHTILGQTWEWLTAFNLETNIPGPVPVKLYADIGTYARAKESFSGAGSLVWDAGVMFYFFKDYLQVYFPVLESDDIKQTASLSDEDYLDKVRFMLKFPLNVPAKMRNLASKSIH